jgi:hypothetical protein
MDQSDSKGAFGKTLARYYHQCESKTAVTPWPEQSTFAISRLHSEVGLPDVSQPIPEEAAIHVSIAIKPVPIRSMSIARPGNQPQLPLHRTFPIAIGETKGCSSVHSEIILQRGRRAVLTTTDAFMHIDDQLRKPKLRYRLSESGREC